MQNYKEIIRPRLSDTRYNHCLNVADAAIMLAKIHGEDIDKAYIAGILHDVTKEISKDEHFEIMDAHGIALTDTEKQSPKVWHQKTGALFAKYDLDVQDEDILNAIAYHTTGRANMTKLEKIVYIADLISAERTYKDVDYFRKIAKLDLDKTMRECLRFSLISLSNNRRLIDNNTLFAYNYFILNKDINL